MAGRYDRKQTRYDPARAGAYACACLIGIAVLGCCFRCARCIAHTASAAPSGAAAKPSDFWQGKVLAPYSGDELVYNVTLGDWRTHNGVDAAAAAGDEVPAVKGGRVSVVEDDALWGGVVEIVDANGCTWRYCGVTPGCVVGGDVAAGDVIGVVAAIPAEADLASHVHLECLKDGTWMKPEI